MSHKNPTFAVKFKWRAEVLAYDLLSLMLKPFSFDAVSRLGGWLFRRIGPKTSKHAIVMTGLRTAFPNKSEDELSALATAQWDNVGRTSFEFPLLGSIKVFGDKSRVTVKGLDHLRRAHEQGNGFVVVSGHFANWEIMGAVLTQAGLPVSVTYRPPNNPYFDKRIQQQREKYGIKLLIAKSNANGARALIGTLKNGHGVAMLGDQKFNQGIAVPFFDVEAMTEPSAVRMALSRNAPIVPVCVKRDKAKFTFTAYPPIDLETYEDREKSIKEGVKAVTKFIETRIIEQPDQWFWVHRRWAKSHYKK